MVARLSIYSTMGGFGKVDFARGGFVKIVHRSWGGRRSQIASFEASLAPMYSALVVERAMSDCFLAFQDTAVWR